MVVLSEAFVVVSRMVVSSEAFEVVSRMVFFSVNGFSVTGV